MTKSLRPKSVKPASLSDQPICTTDLLATVAELSGVKLPDRVGEDSVSFLPALQGKAIPRVTDRGIVHHSDAGIFAIRHGKWKLHLDNKGGSRRSNPKDPAVINSSDLLLFDMEEDVGESTNLSAEFPERLTQLKKLLADIVSRGRSTPSEAQQNDPLDGKKKWKQLQMVEEYL